MFKKKLIWLLAIFFLTTISFAEAQQTIKIPRIAYLVAGSALATSAHHEAFRKQLGELGYVEGKNIIIEWRFAEGKNERLPDLVAELIRIKVDVIFTGNATAARAAKNGTTTIPIVVALTLDPVANGLVTSLARPGGNITGLTRLSGSPELSGKQLELLKEALPKISLVTVLRARPTERGTAQAAFNEIQVVAQALGVQLQLLEVGRADDFDIAFSAMFNKHPGALMVTTSPILNIHEPQIVKFTLKNRLPSMFQRAEAVDAGGLMYYGPNDTDLFRRAATYVDKILKGAKPADLPVEQPMKFDFIINLKTAKQIGVTISPNVLARADRVIR
jgi:putative ABC transport system substrate-binding protein